MLHYREDIVNCIRAITAPLVFFYPFVFGFPYDQQALFALAAFAVVGDMNYILHLHIHHPFCKNPMLNKVIDLCLGSVTGMTSANWLIQHKYGHHAGQDSDYVKGDCWELKRYSIIGALSFSLRSIPATYVGPFVEAFQKGVLRNTIRPINYRHAFVEQLAQLLFVTALLFANPWITLTYVLPWYVVVYFISRYVDYLNHYGCSDSELDFANNSLSPAFNFTTHNFGYHTAHHLFAAAHWTKLPQIHKDLDAQIPEARKKRFSWAILLLPYHFWLSYRGRM